MTKENISNRTSDKKKGATYRKDTDHVESQDASQDEETKTEEEE